MKYRIVKSKHGAIWVEEKLFGLFWCKRGKMICPEGSEVSFRDVEEADFFIKEKRRLMTAKDEVLKTYD